MASWELEHDVVVHLLDAAGQVLEHLRAMTITHQDVGLTGSRQSSTMCAQLRRLRTYLQRCASARSNIVELELGEDDQNLLVAVSLFAVAGLDRRMTTGVGNKAAWLEAQRSALGDIAVQFATRRIEPVPVADDAQLATPTVLELMREIQRRLVAEGSRTGAFRLTRETSGLPPGATAPNETPRPRTAPREPVRGRPSPAPGSGGAPMSGIIRSGAGSRSFGVPDHPMMPVPGGGTAAPESPPPPAAAPAASSPPSAESPAEPAPPAPEPRAPVAATGSLIGLDPRRIREPRLRSLLALDLRALDRAFAANDHRLTAVHLASILEAACIDVALPRRRELGLNGAPETWKLEQLIQAVTGEEVSPGDRSRLFTLIASRGMLRPACQLSSPMAITRANVEQLLELVRRVLVAVGLASNDHWPALRPSDG